MTDGKPRPNTKHVLYTKASMFHLNSTNLHSKEGQTMPSAIEVRYK